MLSVVNIKSPVLLV